MKLGHRNTVALVSMLAFAVLVTNVAVGSLHLCFDGSETPVTLHSLSDGLLHSAESGRDHTDRDVEPAKPALVKLLWHGVDLPLLAVAFVLQMRLLVSFARNDHELPVGQSIAAFLRPRPRAPPF